MSRTLLALSAAGAAIAGALTPTSAAQTFTTLVRDGDPVVGMGLVTSIHTFAVNDSGSWVASVFTDAALDRNLALLRDGTLQLAEGGTMPGTGGATLQAFDGVSLNAAGNSCWNLFVLGGTPPLTQTAVFINQAPVRRQGDPITSAGFTPGTTYRSFSEVVFTDAGDAFMIADVDDPQIPGLNDQVAVKLDLAGTTLVGETTVLRRFDTPAALGGDAVTEIEKGPGQIDMNSAGSVALVARTSSNRAALLIDGEVIARENDLSPEEGRRWQTLTSRPLDLNAHGALVYRADLDGARDDDEVVVLYDAGRHEVLLREGVAIVTPGGLFHIENFGGAPVALSDRNDVVAFVDWDDVDRSRDEGLLYNGLLVVQEGVTRVGGSTVVSLGDGVPTLFELSPDGDCFAFQCVLEGFVDALVLADVRELPGPFCDASDGARGKCPCGGGGAVTGCENGHTTGGVRLRLTSQAQQPFNRATLVGTGFPVMSFTPNVLLRASTREPSAVVFGNGLRCVGIPVTRLGATFSTGGATTHVVGHGEPPGTYAYQLWFRDMPLSFCDPTAAFNLSNGRSLRW